MNQIETENYNLSKLTKVNVQYIRIRKIIYFNIKINLISGISSSDF